MDCFATARNDGNDIITKEHSDRGDPESYRGEGAAPTYADRHIVQTMRALVFILSFAVVQTLLADSQWTKSTQGCEVWNTDPQPNEAATWTGSCIDGKASGYGVLTWKFERDGALQTERYEGEMRGGRSHGRGTYTFVDGRRYEGEWVDGKAHGHGVITHPRGGSYEGEFKKNKFHGYGIRTYYNDTRFEGQFIAGKEHGIGQCRDINGDWRICEYSYGIFRGWR